MQHPLLSTDLPLIFPFSILFQNFSILSCMIIVISVSMYCMGTLPSLKNNSIWRQSRSAIDLTCMVWFTIEFIGRVIVCPDRKEFVKSASNWIDFLSILPSYLTLIFPKALWIRNMVIIRLLRLFRFFKLSYGLQVLLHTLKASSHELLLLLLILLIPVVIFSSLVHTVESALNEDTYYFRSIPETFWWCLITMTTVGYGDLVPQTWAGKCIGGICAICGILIVALPISVIGSNFSLYYAHVRARLNLPRKKRHILEGNLRGLLKQPLSLSSRERDRRGLKRNQSMRRRAPPGNPTYAQTFLQLVKGDEAGSNSNLDTLSCESKREEDGSRASLSWDNSEEAKPLTDRRSHPNQTKGKRRAAVVINSLSETDEQSEHDGIHEGAPEKYGGVSDGQSVEQSKTDERKLSETANLPTVSERNNDDSSNDVRKRDQQYFIPTNETGKYIETNCNSFHDSALSHDPYSHSKNNDTGIRDMPTNKRRDAIQNHKGTEMMISRGRRGALLTDNSYYVSESESDETEDDGTIDYNINCNTGRTPKLDSDCHILDLTGRPCQPEVKVFGNEDIEEATRSEQAHRYRDPLVMKVSSLTSPRKLQDRKMNCVNGSLSSSEKESEDEVPQESVHLLNIKKSVCSIKDSSRSNGKIPVSRVNSSSLNNKHEHKQLESLDRTRSEGDMTKPILAPKYLIRKTLSRQNSVTHSNSGRYMNLLESGV